MVKHNFYSNLSLERTEGCEQLVSKIDWMLTQPEISPSRTDQLQTARAILGDPGRRWIYDQHLDNPSAPAMPINELHQLAASQPTFKQPGNSLNRNEMTSQIGAKLTILAGAIKYHFKNNPIPSWTVTGIAGITILSLGFIGIQSGPTTPRTELLSTDHNNSNKSQTEGSSSNNNVERAKERYAQHDFLSPGEPLKFTRGSTYTSPSGKKAREVNGEVTVSFENPRIIDMLRSPNPDLLEHERTQSAVCIDKKVEDIQGEISSSNWRGAQHPRDFPVYLIYNGDTLGTKLHPELTYTVSPGDSSDLVFDDNYTWRNKGESTMEGNTIISSYCTPIKEEYQSQDGYEITGFAVHPTLRSKEDDYLQAEMDENTFGWLLELD